ncbi:unnamed protein product [Lupinus luteus]|uniref:Uncharacterized protein n=1 Tax=Lupinus luteus TaxID=3873 RepID=A0AAV1WB08_LUPLU
MAIFEEEVKEDKYNLETKWATCRGTKKKESATKGKGKKKSLNPKFIFLSSLPLQSIAAVMASSAEEPGNGHHMPSSANILGIESYKFVEI